MVDARFLQLGGSRGVVRGAAAGETREGDARCATTKNGTPGDGVVLR